MAVLGGVELSVAWIVNENEPDSDGVPDSKPEELSVMPGGGVPVKSHVNLPVPPTA